MAPPPKLEPGNPDDEYPLNEQGSAEFNVGGVRRILPPAEQLEQLLSYMDATYPAPSFDPAEGDAEACDRYVALLPDRITHAALMMLGTAVDHTMPGVAFAAGVSVSDSPVGAVFTPSQPTGRWAVAVYPQEWWTAGGRAREHSWQPEMAAAAELSGTTIIDTDSPAAAIEHARAQGASSVAAWAYSSGAELLTDVLVDATVLTFPTTLPPTETRTLLQVASQDEVAPHFAGGKEYLSRHRISTPEVARHRVRDVADFLRTV